MFTHREERTLITFNKYIEECWGFRGDGNFRNTSPRGAYTLVKGRKTSEQKSTYTIFYNGR